MGQPQLLVQPPATARVATAATSAAAERAAAAAAAPVHGTAAFVRETTTFHGTTALDRSAPINRTSAVDGEAPFGRVTAVNRTTAFHGQAAVRRTASFRQSPDVAVSRPSAKGLRPPRFLRGEDPLRSVDASNS